MRTNIAAVSILLCATACTVQVVDSGESAGEEQVQSHEQDLMGGQIFASPLGCTFDQTKIIRDAMVLGRTVARSDAFAQCVDRVSRMGGGRSNTGPYIPCIEGVFSYDPFFWNSSTGTQIQRAINISRSSNRVELLCRDIDGASGLASVHDDGYGHGGDEEIKIDPDFVSGDSDSELASIAGLVWHEALHTHGYLHDASGAGDAGELECLTQTALGQSMNYIVQRCIQEVWSRSTINCDRDECMAAGARLPIVDGYDSTSCECVRDAVGQFTETGQYATLRFDTNEFGDLFGRALAVGDFNGDGFDDLAVGAPGENSSAGTVYIYRGSNLGLYPDYELRSWFTSNPLDLYGWALAAGDFDGDGIDDLVVGAPGRFGSGRIVAWAGTATRLGFRSELGQAPVGVDEPGDDFGYALAAGDFDGDGADDLAVGAPGERPGSAPQSGFAFIMQGDFRIDLLRMWAGLRQTAVDTENDGERFGESVASGRFADSSHDMLAVGAPEDAGTGKAFLFTSAPSVTATTWAPSRALTDPGLTPGARFGHALAVGQSAGFGRVFVGAPRQHRPDALLAGTVFTFDESGLLLDQLDGEFLEQLGAALTVAPLTDTFTTLFVGSDSPFIPARVRVVNFRPVTLDQTGMGVNEIRDYFGAALATGDLDGNGVEGDLVIGAPGEAPGNDPAFSGAVFTYRSILGTRFDPMVAFNQED